VTAIFADIRRKQGALHPGISRSSVEVQFDCLRWRADANFGDVQCVVFDIFNLHEVSTKKKLVAKIFDIPGPDQDDR